MPTSHRNWKAQIDKAWNLVELDARSGQLGTSNRIGTKQSRWKHQSMALGFLHHKERTTKIACVIFKAHSIFGNLILMKTMVNESDSHRYDVQVVRYFFFFDNLKWLDT